MSISLGVSFPLLDGSGFLGGVKAEPCGWPAASRDSACGRQDRPAIGIDAVERSGSWRALGNGQVAEHEVCGCEVRLAKSVAVKVHFACGPVECLLEVHRDVEVVRKVDEGVEG
jgi:hypothetical protein